MFEYLHPSEGDLSTTAETMVLDKGLGIGQLNDLLNTGSPYISIIKFGWGTTAFMNKSIIEEKIKLIKEHRINVCPGGTFFELAYLKGCVKQYYSDIKELGFNCIEISDGTIDIPLEEKVYYIKEAKKIGLIVVSEVGKKQLHEDHRLDVSQRKKSMIEELNAGASKVILEAQEGGRRGIFDEHGNIKGEFLEELVCDIGIDNIIFEAPIKEQQVWLIKRFGSNVNLGNIKPEDTVSLATLRKGFRADTLKQFNMQGITVRYELGVPGAVVSANRGDVVVVIDSLRASSTILAGFDTGLDCIVPVNSVEQCIGKLSAGERGGYKVSGLTHSNSPAELINYEYSNKTLYLTTTNGTECILASSNNNSIVLIGTLLNAKSVAEVAVKLAKKHRKDITILCAGRNNQEATEDTISATEIGFYIQGNHIHDGFSPRVTDSYLDEFLKSESGKNLVKLGYRNDVEFSARKNVYDKVPIYSEGKLVLYNDL